MRNSAGIPDMKTSPGSNKLLMLEGLRFVASLAVLLWHYPNFAYVGSVQADLARSDLPFYGLFFPLYEAGRYAVWIFWCISGFIFFWRYRDAISSRSIDGWTFFVYRLSRLYPLHLATLLLMALLQPLYLALHGSFFAVQNNDLPHFLAQLVMASDWMGPRSESFNAPIWSVSVEVLVYAFFFFCLRFVSRSPLFNLAVILAALTVGTQVTTCMAFFYAGGVAAIVRQDVADVPHRRWLEAMAACTAVMVAGVLWLSADDHAAVAGPLLLLTTPLVLFCCSGHLVLPPRVGTLLETAGNMTYSCYLLHFPFQLTIALGFSLVQRPIPYQSPLFWMTFVLPTLVASHFTFRYFEAPAQRIIRSLLLRGGAKQASPASL
jgi:peptidoglycan/LPS O-acetylase OafA/YrhL